MMETDRWTIGAFPQFLFALNPVQGVSREAVSAPPFTAGSASRDGIHSPLQRADRDVASAFESTGAARG